MGARVLRARQAGARTARARARCVAGALLASAVWAATASAELRRIEVEGAAPLASGSAPGAEVRAAAQQDALIRAVVQAARELLAPPGGPAQSSTGPATVPGAVAPSADGAAARSPSESAAPAPSAADTEREARARAAVAASPLDYAARYRIVQDLGPRPRTLLQDPAVAQEYAVRVEAHIDLERLRRRLASAGLSAPARESAALQRHVIRLSGLTSLAQSTLLRRLVAQQLGAKSALIVEAAPARIAIAVEAPLDETEAGRRLTGLAENGLRLDPDPSGEGGIALRVVEAPGSLTAPAAAPAAATPAPPPDAPASPAPAAESPASPSRAPRRVDGL